MKKLLLILWLLPCLATPATYYVSSNSGNNGNAGTIAAPWETVSYSLSQITGGDSLLMAGTFQETDSTDLNGVLTTMYIHGFDGSEGDSTYFGRWPDSANPIIQADSNNFRRSIVMYVCNYFILENLVVRSSNKGLYLLSCEHLRIDSVESYWHYGSTGESNVGGIHPDGVKYMTLQHCILHDIFGRDGWRDPAEVNSSGIHMYYTDSSIIQDNIIYNIVGGNGISNKREDSSCIIRNNTIYKSSTGYRMLGLSNDTYFYGNVIHDLTGFGISFDEPGVAASDHSKIFNNTVYNVSGVGFQVAGSISKPGIHVWNNIITNDTVSVSGHYRMATRDCPLPDWYSDYNCFYDPLTSIIGYWQDADPVVELNLAAWRTASGGDGNSIQSDPLMTDPSGGDWTLQAGSPCLTTYKDTTFTLWNGEEITTDGMGAYNVFTDGVARDSTVSTPVEENPHTPIQRRTGNVKTTGDKVIIE